MINQRCWHKTDQAGVSEDGNLLYGQNTTAAAAISSSSARAAAKYAHEGVKIHCFPLTLEIAVIVALYGVDYGRDSHGIQRLHHKRHQLSDDRTESAMRHNNEFDTPETRPHTSQINTVTNHEIGRKLVHRTDGRESK